jgi:hypothetical protein
VFDQTVQTSLAFSSYHYRLWPSGTTGLMPWARI